VVAVPAVGAILAVAVLVAPAAIARLWTRHIPAMTAIAAGAGSGLPACFCPRTTTSRPAAPSRGDRRGVRALPHRHDDVAHAAPSRPMPGRAALELVPRGCDVRALGVQAVLRRPAFSSRRSATSCSSASSPPVAARSAPPLGT